MKTLSLRRIIRRRAVSSYNGRHTGLERGERLLDDSTEDAIRVAIVDDQRLFTRGLSGLVGMLDGVEVVGVAYDGEEAVALCRREEPDVVLMDISMPNMDGISATREIKDLLPQTAVVILTGHEEDEHVFEGIKAGAQGYLLKDSEPEDLSRAIHTVYAGNTIIAPDLAQKMLNTFEAGGREGKANLAPPPLTERELEVIKALARGMSDRQIARSLDISEKTVRNHTSNIYRKLHIFDRTQAVIYAVREGIIDVEELDYRPPREP
jgi:DNA-binding NarL/FixJ family response regulator